MMSTCCAAISSTGPDAVELLAALLAAGGGLSDGDDALLSLAFAELEALGCSPHAAPKQKKIKTSVRDTFTPGQGG
jgi:hypothetical protein